MASKYASTKKSYLHLRAEFLRVYGGKCECCGETEPDFLTCDHIHGGGTKTRFNKRGKRYRKSYEGFQPLKKAGWPKDVVRILCFNCNCARAKAHNFGICPHERQRLVDAGQWPPTQNTKAQARTYSPLDDPQTEFQF